MNNIYNCVNSFTALLNTEYHLILGRKEVSVSLKISFDKKDCFHLMGLQYLTDRPELKRDRGKIFDDIKARKITKEHIESSALYKKIAERVELLPFLEELFDSNDTIFKYCRKSCTFSMIQADFLMKSKLGNKNLYIFLSKYRGDCYFCRSFFPETKRDYTENQALWTLLYKEKIDKFTNHSFVLYDRFKN